MAEPTRAVNGCSHLMWFCVCMLIVTGGYVVLIALSARTNGYGGKDARAQLGCKSLETAIEAYIQHKDNPKQEFPNTLNDLVEPPFGGSSFLRNGRADTIDPWGKPYEFERARWSDGTEYILVKTTTPDGTPISQFGIGKNSRPGPSH
jgi:hypothetical protein